MKAVLMSIHPKWCELIFSGKKTIEVRKTAPKLETPFKVYVYRTKHKGKSIVSEALNAVYGGGKVVGEFVCDSVVKYNYETIICAKFEVNGADVAECKRYNAGACLTAEEMYEYSNGDTLYGLHITEPKLYDTPKELSEFKKGCDDMSDPQFGSYCGYCPHPCFLTRAPQSWCYVEEVEE